MRVSLGCRWSFHSLASVAASATRAFAGVVLAGVVLAGCGSTGASNLELATADVPANKARLTITRTSDILYMGVPATIKVNGKKVASLALGASTIVDIAPGSNVISADAWSYPGTFSVKLEAKAGQRYALEVAPRGDSFLPGALLGPFGGAIDASVNENAGAFQLRFTDSKEANAVMSQNAGNE